MSDQAVTWLYAITDRSVGVPDTGVAGEHPRLVTATTGLVAAVGTVDTARFGPDALPHTLADLDTVSAIARAHHGVISHIAAQAPALASRLATLFRSDSAVTDALDQREQQLREALARIDGHSEWGVKVTQRAEPSPAVAPPDTGGGAGTQYLMRRRAELTAHQHNQAALAEQAAEIHRTLSAVATAAQRITGRPLPGMAPLALNGAYLVDNAATGAFTDAVADLGGRYPGLAVELTGPWPAYSFASAENPDQR